ncbi:MAG: hypothetical protein ACRDV6_10610 [Acidimicrobiales bacterium]
MTTRGPNALLRWYPAEWRTRYGGELTALMEDQLGGRTPTARFRSAIAFAGLRERAFASGVIGRSAPPAVRVRTSVLVVLGAWSAFVIAGASLAKFSEHFPSAVTSADLGTPTTSLNVLTVIAVVAGVLAVTAALAAAPALVRLLRAGGWRPLKRPAFAAALLTAIAGAGIGAVAPWAHSLTNAQRNGADAGYSAAFLAVGFAGVVALTLWTWAAMATARRVDVGMPVLRLWALVATAVALSMVAMTALAGVWWASIASDAPWFLHGAANGTPGSPFNLQLVLTAALMLAATVASVLGIVRMTRSWNELGAGSAASGG